MRLFPFSKPSKHRQHYDTLKCQIIVTKLTSSICSNIHEQPFTKRYPHWYMTPPTTTTRLYTYTSCPLPNRCVGVLCPIESTNYSRKGLSKVSALSAWVCSIQHSISPGTLHVTTRSQARPAWQEHGPHPPHHNIAKFPTNIWRCLTTNTKIKSQSHMWPHDASMSLFTVHDHDVTRAHSLSRAWLRCSQ